MSIYILLLRLCVLEDVSVNLKGKILHEHTRIVNSIVRVLRLLGMCPLSRVRPLAVTRFQERLRRSNGHGAS